MNISDIAEINQNSIGKSSGNWTLLRAEALKVRDSLLYNNAT